MASRGFNRSRKGCDHMLASVTIGMFASITLAFGLLLSFTPYLMPRNECFAVTVPALGQKDPVLVALKKRYAVIMISLTVASTVVATVAGAFVIQGSEEPETGTFYVGIILETGAVLIPIVASFILMLVNRHRVAEIKKERGWVAVSHQMTAIIVEEDIPRAIPFAWSLLYIPIILGTIALGLVLYPHMPDMLPMHADFTGNVDRWEPKTLGSGIGFPVVFEIFMAACFVFCHWMILRSKRPLNPKSPAASAVAYGLFARAQSIFLLATGILLSGGIGVLFLLSSAGFIELAQAGVVIIVLCVPVVIGSIVLSLVYGQAGSRVFKRIQEDEGLIVDDDDHWKLGVFYFNSDDASLFLPERFGFGWTINLARPAAWAFILGGFAITVGFIVVVAFLV